MAERKPRSNRTRSGPAERKLPKGQQSGAAPGAASPNVSQDHRAASVSGIDELCGVLVALQRDRCFAIRQQGQSNHAALAYIRNRLGYTTGLAKPGRAALAAAAMRIKKAIERGMPEEAWPEEADMVRGCTYVVLRLALARQEWDRMRANTEKEMQRLARRLPAWPFVDGVAGAGALGLAVLVGEAGDLARYPTKGHLWKRLGLAVVDGGRQGSVPPGLDPQARKEAWIERKYNPRRLAEIYAFFYDALLRQQWQKNTARGPYGEYYARKKAEYVERGHKGADRAARRAMAKMFVRDVWNAWRRAVAAADAVPQERRAA